MLSTIIAQTFSIPILFLWIVGVFTYTHATILKRQYREEQRELEEQKEWEQIERQIRFKIGLDATNTYKDKEKKNDQDTQ